MNHKTDGKRVLLVHVFFDSRNGRVQAKLQSKLPEYGIIVANTVSAAITLCAQYPPDLIVLGLGIVDLEDDAFGELKTIRTQIERLKRARGTSRIVLLASHQIDVLTPVFGIVLKKTTADDLALDIERLFTTSAAAA